MYRTKYDWLFFSVDFKWKIAFEIEYLLCVSSFGNLKCKRDYSQKTGLGVQSFCFVFDLIAISKSYDTYLAGNM